MLGRVCGALMVGAALCAVPGIASAGSSTAPSNISGYGEFYWQQAWAQNSDSYYNPLTYWGAAGRMNVWLAPQWSAQADLLGQWFTTRNDTTTYFDGAAGMHLSYRDTQKGLIGVFGGLAAVNDYGNYGYGTDPSVYGGVEGQAYWGDMTLYGQVGYIYQLSGEFGPGSNSQHDNWFAQAALRYFLTPTTKIEGTCGYLAGPLWGPGNHDLYAHGWEFGAEAEHQFQHTPLSVFARVDYLRDPDYYYSDFNRLAVGVGIRVRFGDTKTLLDQDRSGATLKTYNFDTIGYYRWQG